MYHLDRNTRYRHSPLVFSLILQKPSISRWASPFLDGRLLSVIVSCALNKQFFSLFYVHDYRFCLRISNEFLQYHTDLSESLFEFSDSSTLTSRPVILSSLDPDVYWRDILRSVLCDLLMSSFSFLIFQFYYFSEFLYLCWILFSYWLPISFGVCILQESIWKFLCVLFDFFEHTFNNSF